MILRACKNSNIEFCIAHGISKAAHLQARLPSPSSPPPPSSAPPISTYLSLAPPQLKTRVVPFINGLQEHKLTLLTYNGGGIPHIGKALHKGVRDATATYLVLTMWTMLAAGMVPPHAGPAFADPPAICARSLTPRVLTPASRCLR